jgi:hypothetical protein
MPNVIENGAAQVPIPTMPIVQTLGMPVQV